MTLKPKHLDDKTIDIVRFYWLPCKLIFQLDYILWSNEGRGR